MRSLILQIYRVLPESQSVARVTECGQSHSMLFLLCPASCSQICFYAELKTAGSQQTTTETYLVLRAQGDQATAGAEAVAKSSAPRQTAPTDYCAPYVNIEG